MDDVGERSQSEQLRTPIFRLINSSLSFDTSSSASSASNSGSPSAPSLALTRKEDGHWSLNPFFDCGASRSWVVAYSLPFYGRHGTGFKARLKGVVLVTFPLTLVDLNQCEEKEMSLIHHIFGGTHKCDVATTQVCYLAVVVVVVVVVVLVHL
ncbi:uncharacterized protein LOC134767061 [Penaeus indicus]|uniref:uncharacterized protein LOC134767061 n=1 Tax=Penaeus indicus TaxID=29960 RepID=UPI00300D261B